MPAEHRRQPRITFVAAAALAAATALLLVPVTAVPAQASSPSTLRTAADSRGIAFGTAVNANALSQNTGYRSRLGAEFGSVTPEDAMKWAVVEPIRGQYDFTGADQIVDFATQHGQAVRGHTLVWHESLPDWLTTGSFTTDELRAMLKAHIEVLLSRYAGRVGVWDVVNEAFAEDGSLRSSFWLQRLGPGYVADAFRWAHAADPTAKLDLNDYGIESIGPKSSALYALVRDLRAQGVPIDGVGVQTHAMVSSQLSQLTRVLRRFADLGVDVAITELDVRMPVPVQSGALAAQAAVYGRAIAACLAVPRCRSVTVWGFTDAYSWVPAAFPGWGAADLLDGAMVDKPAYATALQTLTGGQPPADAPAGWWWLDDGSGAGAVDASGGGHPATVSGGGQLGQEGRVPGVSAYAGAGEASAAGPVVRTDASFTVAAWVRLSDRSGARVAVSQDGPTVSGFYLMYQQYSDRWEFTMPSAPRAPLTWQTAQSLSVPRLGVWTHLVGVYDATAGQLRLYVDGTLEATRSGVVSWPATGPLRIGRGFSGANFTGNISDVRVWPRPLAAGEIADVADRSAGFWPLDSTTGDGSGFGRDAQQTPAGVGWGTGHGGQAGSAVTLAGAGSVDTAGPIVFTNRSYTVAAWVNLADKADYRVAVSQDGTVRSALYLEYHPVYDRWAYIVPTSDADTTGWQTVLSTAAPTLNTWTRLVAVYDADAAQLRLYVNGVRQGVVNGATSWQGGGPFHIGRAISGSFFAGGIDDVHVYTYAFSDNEAAAA